MSKELWRYVAWTLGLALAVGLPVAASSHGWLATELSTDLLVVALASPAAVAVAITARNAGRGGLRRLLWRPRLRVAVAWWAVALATPFAINALALFAHALGGGTVPDLPGSPAPEQQGVPLWLLPLAFGAFSLAEEVGWRRFALPRLQARLTALTASLVLALVWMAWHLPLNLIAGSTQSSMGHGWYLAGLLAVSVVFTWLYNSTGGSLAAVTLLHASTQASNAFVPVLPSATGTATTYQLSVVVTVLLALGLLAAFGARDLSRAPRQVDAPGGLGLVDSNGHPRGGRVETAAPATGDQTAATR